MPIGHVLDTYENNQANDGVDIIFLHAGNYCDSIESVLRFEAIRSL